MTDWNKWYRENLGNTDPWEDIIAVRQMSDYELPALPAADKFAPQGWLSPRGELRPCSFTGHNLLQVVIERSFGISNIEDENPPWVKLGWNTRETHPEFYPETRNMEFEPTREQVNAIIDWCEHYDMEYPYFMKPVELLAVPSVINVPDRMF